MIEQTLGTASPASVIVVDLSETAAFVAKAPKLAALAGRAEKGAFHVRLSGADFLDELRLASSKVFVHRAIAKGVTEFQHLAVICPRPAAKPHPNSATTISGVFDATSSAANPAGPRGSPHPMTNQRSGLPCCRCARPAGRRMAATGTSAGGQCA